MCIQILFDPINPDKETVKTRETSLSEKQDSEFWLLQKLDSVMQKANFHELSKSKVDQLLTEHQVQGGIRVSLRIRLMLLYFSVYLTLRKIAI